MRKLLAAVLIVTLLVNLFGNFISFTAQRYQIHKQRTLRKMDDAKEYSFTPEEFSKLDLRDGGKEFCLKGGMHDIVRQTERNGKIVLLAYFDHQETDLFSEFLAFFQDETSSSKNKPHQLPSFTLFEFVATDCSLVIFNPERFISLPVYSSHLLNTSFDTQSPPPDRV